MKSNFFMLTVALFLLVSASYAGETSASLPAKITVRKTVAQRLDDIDQALKKIQQESQRLQEISQVLLYRRDELASVVDKNQTVEFVVDNDGRTTSPIVDLRPVVKAKQSH